MLAKNIDIIGKSFLHDKDGKPTAEGWNDLSKTLSIYSNKNYETARYLFVKDGQIIRHISVSSGTPSSTVIKPDDDFVYSLRTYAEKTDSNIIFLHNHPSGFVAPSNPDIELTQYMENCFIDNNGKSRFQGHIILDHGNFGLYTKDTGWKALIDNKMQDIKNLDNTYRIQLSEYGMRVKTNSDLILLSEKAKELDAGNTWNKDDWIPAWFTTQNGVVRSLEYFNTKEIENTDSLKEKFRNIGRDNGSEYVYLFPYSRNQQMMCERFAQQTGMIRDVYLELEPEGFELSQFPGGNIFTEVRTEDISIDDTENYDKEILKEQFIKNSEINTNIKQGNKTMETSKNVISDAPKSKQFFNHEPITFKDLDEKQNVERAELVNNSELQHIFNFQRESVYDFFDFENHRDEEIEFLKACKDLGTNLNDIYGMERAVEQYLRKKINIPLFENGEYVQADKEQLGKIKPITDYVNFLSYDIVGNKKEAIQNRGIKNLSDLDKKISELSLEQKSNAQSKVMENVSDKNVSNVTNENIEDESLKESNPEIENDSLEEIMPSTPTTPNVPSIESLQSQMALMMKKLEQVISENESLLKENELLRANVTKVQNPEKVHEAGGNNTDVAPTPTVPNFYADHNGFSRETAFKVNSIVPKFGQLEDGAIKIYTNCRFQKVIENEIDQSQNKVVLIQTQKDGTNKEVVIPEFEYYKIINNSEELEKSKATVAQDSFAWMRAHQLHDENLLLDQNKYRLNVACNFHHNFMVRCQIEKPRNPDEAMDEARKIIDGMSSYEKHRFNVMRSEMGAEQFDELLIKEFQTNVEQQDMNRAEFITPDILKEANKKFLELPIGSKIGKTDVKVGDSIKMAVKTKGIDGKLRKTPATDFKIIKVSQNFKPDKAIIYSEKTKSSYSIPLEDLEKHIMKMQKEIFKEKKRDIKKDNRKYGYENREL